MKVSVVAGVSLFVAASVLAGPKGPAFKHADKNKDGHIGPKEAKMERKKVDTPWEAKADKNKDGKIGPGEAAVIRKHEYLRNRSAVDRPWEAKADKNDDGKVDAVELRAYHMAQMDKNGNGVIDASERKLYWEKKWRIVDTGIEKKYDADGDGYLDWPEARKMLRDRLTVIETDGQAIVNTDIELEFDTNADGLIDRKEAKALQAALAD